MKKLLVPFSILLFVLAVSSCTSHKDDSKNDRPNNSRMEQQGQGGPDLEMVAEKLGVTQDELTAALGDMSQATPEKIQEAATILGVSEQELMDAMGPPPGGPQK